VWSNAHTKERVLRHAAGYRGRFGNSAPSPQHPAPVSHQIVHADASGFEPQRGELTKPWAKGLGLQIEER